MVKEISEIAEHLYEGLGPGHKDKTYRDAMALELQERGYIVKTEVPSNIVYTTKTGKTMILGSQKVDICANKDGKYTFIEIRVMLSFLKGKDDIDEVNYLKTRKYLSSMGLEEGILINFPFPPMDDVEIIENKVGQ
tara:strand:+ start:134 stop:541 length:408 start_codon:yes stop_codon:yes gene_type:complete